MSQFDIYDPHFCLNFDRPKSGPTNKEARRHQKHQANNDERQQTSVVSGTPTSRLQTVATSCFEEVHISLFSVRKYSLPRKFIAIAILH